ncbi:MAG: NRDE family protein [Planctomycetales bacterium]|nr:NRDE family protein [Planctomycetales bacterium]
MCLLLALRDVVKDHPLVLLANRDEFYDRPSEPPASRGGEPEVVCGLDRRAGGTWAGLNGAGVAVVLTNRAGGYDAKRPSRGPVARGALEARGATEAVERAAAYAAEEGPNPFCLFAADATSAAWVAWDGAGSRVERVRSGLHTLTNWHDLDALSPVTVCRVADGGPAFFMPGMALDEAVQGLARVARSHAPLGPPKESVCAHHEARGTVSSTLLAVAKGGRPALYRYADGPPCRTEFRDFPLPRERARL